MLQNGVSALDLQLPYRTLLLLPAQRTCPPGQACKISRVRRLVFAPPTSHACCRATNFSESATTLVPRVQIVQPQAGVLHWLGTNDTIAGSNACFPSIDPLRG